MADVGVQTPQFPQATDVDDLIGNKDGSTVRIDFDTLTVRVGANLGPTYETLAQINADLAWPDGSLGAVWNDADEANIGVYKKSGLSGAGSWARIANLPLNILTDLAGAAATAAALSEANSANSEIAALSAAESSGPIAFYDTKAAANAALGGLTENDVVEVLSDESRSGGRSRYRVESAALVWKLDLTGQIILVNDIAELKALSVANETAYIIEAGREAVAVWDAAIIVADHQADPYERIYVAPNAGANGAWVLHPEGGVLSTETAGGASSVGLPTEPQKPTVPRQSRISTGIKLPAAARAIMPIWPWLPHASAAVNGQQGLIMPHTGSPIPVAQSGGSWYNLTSGAAITNDFVPNGATFVFDRANSQYYFAGASKVIGDFTAITVGGKSRHKLNGNDLGIGASQEYTVLVEYELPETPGLTAAEMLFSMTEPAISNNRTEVALSTSLTVAGNPSLFHARPSGVSASYVMQHHWGAAGSQRPLAYGRQRLVFASKVGAGMVMGKDGFPVAAGGTSITGTINIDRIALGYRALNGLEDNPILSDAIYDSMRVVIWPYAMGVEEVERAVEHSEAGLRPWMIMGDSNNFDPGLADPAEVGGYGIASKLKALTVADGYRCVGTHWAGGTAWYRESVAAANDNMLTHLRAKPDRVKAWDFIFTDSQADENAAANVCGMDEAVSWFGHSRWVTLQSFYGLNRRPTDTAAREAYDVLRSELLLRVAAEHLVDPMPEMLAASDGSPQDIIDVADGVTPTTTMKDSIHFNHTTGVSAYAGAIKTALEANGMIDGGQWS